MRKPAGQPDSLDQIELLMALEEEVPYLEVLTDALERWDQRMTREQALRLIPHVVKPMKVRCIRNGFETEVILIARRLDVGLGIDRSCRQFAVGAIVGETELQNTLHHPTLELALRSFESLSADNGI